MNPVADAPIRARSERRKLSLSNASIVAGSNDLFPVRAMSFLTLADSARASFFNNLYLFCNCSMDRLATYE